MRSKAWYDNYPNYFWNQLVHKSGPDDCWPIKATLQSGRGYGKVRFNKRGQSAHRVAYILFRGEIPKGMQVCHKCDNPPCCNPAHLFIGTGKDNAQDCIKKSRKVVFNGAANGMYAQGGESSPCHKLTDNEVMNIRQLRRDGLMNTVQLAARFRVSQGAISAVVQGRTWRHLPVGNVRNFKKGVGNPNAKLTEESVKQIKNRHAQGEQQKTLAAEFGVNRITIARVVHGVLWKHV